MPTSHNMIIYTLAASGRNAEALAAQPGCRVLPMRTGHWVMVQAPEAFNAAVLDWLATLKPPAGDNAGHAPEPRHP